MSGKRYSEKTKLGRGRGRERASERERERSAPGVAGEVVAQLAVGQAPHLPRPPRATTTRSAGPGALDSSIQVTRLMGLYLSLSLSLSLTDKYGGSSKGARRPEKQTAPAPPSSAWSRGLCVEGSWGSDGGRALIVAGGGWRGVGERGRRGVP